MKAYPLLALSAFAVTTFCRGADENANVVVLDETGVKNLRIETVVAEPSTFEETAFALGRIEARPDRIATVASHISGRILELAKVTGDRVARGENVLRVESRQPGNPPPSVWLTAPLAGMVTKLDAHLGDPVEPDRELMEITDLGEVLAVARVPEAVAGRLAPDAMAHITVPAAPDTKLAGRLLRFGTSADRETGTLEAIFAVQNPGEKLRPGMRAEFSIVISRRENVVSVPRSALQGDAAGRFVYVKHFDLPHAFAKAPVVVGDSNERVVEIVSGLFPADEVVTRGAHSLAFAGGGTMSLKEALDAAHGHEHNEDGSEMSDAQKATRTSTPSHDHGDHAHSDDNSTPWKIATAALFVALVIVGVRKRRG